MPDVRNLNRVPRDISIPSLFSPSAVNVGFSDVLPRSIMQGQRPSGTRQTVCTQSLPRQLYSRTHNARLKFRNKWTRPVATGLQKP